ECGSLLQRLALLPSFDKSRFQYFLVIFSKSPKVLLLFCYFTVTLFKFYIFAFIFSMLLLHEFVVLSINLFLILIQAVSEQNSLLNGDYSLTSINLDFLSL
uniref:Uncharacterized protein n=1 Tax=Salarias fasciatus TaxID=181472 RepID=A0A672FW62_SALFA